MQSLLFQAWESLCLVKMEWKVDLLVSQDFVNPLMTLLVHTFNSDIDIIKRCSKILLALASCDVKFNSYRPSLLACSSIYLAIEDIYSKKLFSQEVYKLLEEAAKEIERLSLIHI